MASAEFASTILDLNDQGYVMSASGKPWCEACFISEVTDAERKVWLRKPDDELGASVFPKAFQPGDAIVWYEDMAMLSGRAGFVLVRDRRVVSFYCVMMS